MGSSPSRKIQLLGIVHPLWENNFKYLRYTGGRSSSETLVDEERSIWLCLYFVKNWVVNTVFVECTEHRGVIKIVFV